MKDNIAVERRGHFAGVVRIGSNGDRCNRRGILAKRGAGRFIAYSAGSFPKGEVHPLAIQLLKEQNIPTDGFRSKSWDEFAKPGAPQMEYIFTVCDQAAGEMCPVWPGRPVTAHWGLADPAAVEGDEVTRMQAFRDAFVASMMGDDSADPFAEVGDIYSVLDKCGIDASDLGN